MLAPTLYILAFFLGISVLMGILLAVHDGIEYLVTRRNAALAAARVLGGQGFAAGPARRDLRQFVVVSTSQQPEQGGVGSASRELPSWFESASRDVMVQPSALHTVRSRRGPATRAAAAAPIAAPTAQAQPWASGRSGKRPLRRCIPAPLRSRALGTTMAA